VRTRTIFLATAAAAAAVLLTACSSSGSTDANSAGGHDSMPGMTMSAGPSSTSHDGMGGMPMSTGSGLADAVHGYRLRITSQPMSGMAMPVRFVITKDGRPVTGFQPEQTKLMHFYLIRRDLTGFQHLHPVMDDQGSWTVTPAPLGSGSYRIYTQFVPKGGAGAIVLGRPLSVGGKAAADVPLPPATRSTTVDGFEVALSGRVRAGTDSPLQITISKDGRPVTDLQPYLDTYAHVTAIHAGDLAFAHLHPSGTATGGGGGPRLTVEADLPEAGRYRLFIQFMTGARLHTAAITVTSGPAG